MQRRDRIDIIFDMLTAIQQKQKIKPTHLMYKANMTHGQMKGYLDELKAKEFVTVSAEKGQKYFILTDNGYRFILKIKEMKEFEKTFGL